jgi:hypothetical protein
MNSKCSCCGSIPLEEIEVYLDEEDETVLFCPNCFLEWEIEMATQEQFIRENCI